MPTKEASSRDASPSSWSAIALRVALSVVIVSTLLFFFTRLFPASQADESVSQRWNLLLQPFADDFVDQIWFGVDLPKFGYRGERVFAFALGAFVFLAFSFIGRFVLNLLRRAFSSDRLETLFFSGTLGCAIASAATLLLGLSGRANFPLLPFLALIDVVGLVAFSTSQIRDRRTRRKTPSDSDKGEPSDAISTLKEPSRSRYARTVLACELALAALFVSFYLFAATQPLFEYDALEYHAQSAREFFNSGEIAFSPHNAYENMPLGVEMFYLIGLNVARDVGYSGEDVLRIGLLVGKTLVVSLALLTALGIYAFGRRYFRSRRAGLASALVFLSLPLVFENCSNGLNDVALGLPIVASICAFALHLSNSSSDRGSLLGLSALLGVFCGFAISIKYTGVVFVLAPIALALLTRVLAPCFFAKIFPFSDARESERDQKESTSWGGRLAALALFFVATLAIGGGWYARNYAATDNPVYPLAYNIFGDSTGQWNDSINARWRRAHSSSGFGFAAIDRSVKETLWGELYSSPFAPFVPLMALYAVGAFFVQRKRAPSDESIELKRFLFLLGTLAFFVILWFFATHRLVRFLLPIAPIAALLVGCGATKAIRSTSNVLRASTIASALCALLYSGLMIDMIGQGRMAPLRSLENDPARFSKESIYFNARPSLFVDSPDSVDLNNVRRLLLVGEARACAFRVPVLYSTCWNDSPLSILLKDCVRKNDSGKVEEITDSAKLSERLRAERIEYILVDFGELARFRSEGNYGLNNPEIDADLFLLLVQSDVLEVYDPSDMPEKTPSVQLFRVCANRFETSPTY